MHGSFVKVFGCVIVFALVGCRGEGADDAQRELEETECPLGICRLSCTFRTESYLADDFTGIDSGEFVVVFDQLYSTVARYVPEPPW